jgi:hypothetical protein
MMGWSRAPRRTRPPEAVLLDPMIGAVAEQAVKSKER